MKFTMPKGEEAEVQMAPMIDMVFLLLIFFMVASQLNEMNKIDVDLPVAEDSAIPEDQSGRRLISVKETGQVFAGLNPVSLERLTEIVKQELEINPQVRFFIRADEQVRHGEVKKVMKTCAEAGAADLIFATYQSE
ncbi:ExbD/TolR family protein [Kiritimatiella glycovorans]|uniref:Biopolymer transport protein ExbD n=1 Tax=Kiritimatiella glycovorans TaxID=1307763 RepID=A0A0G3EH14_9BACT|nr:biopolymer transporter ExbD [Kiritimatiella glycovorans]AKJ64100.1 Biopolymer transport protein ExbD [Kiritimatiella glycovorans]